jgi:hypothetical protein
VEVAGKLKTGYLHCGCSGVCTFLPDRDGIVFHIALLLRARLCFCLRFLTSHDYMSHIAYRAVVVLAPQPVLATLS